MKITITVPDKKAPGFLKRMMRAAEFQAELSKGLSVELVNRIVPFVADYVTTDDGTPPLTAVWEMSEEDIMNAVAALGSSGSAAPLAGPSAAPSATG